MVNGFNIKKIISLALSAVLIYFIFLVLFQFISYGYKSTVEKELAKYLKTDSVSIGSIFNLPFFSIRLNDVQALSPDFSASIKSALIYYNPLKVFTGGPVSSIYFISIEKLSLKGNIRALKGLESKLQACADQGDNFNLTLSGSEIDINIDFACGIRSDFYLDRLKLKIKNKNISLQTDVSADLHSGNSTGYLMSVLKIDFNYSFAENLGSGKVHFKDINAGGISIINDEDAYFTTGKTFALDLEKSFSSKKIRSENGAVYYTIEKDVSLDYTVAGEYYLFEHIFNDGNFHFNLSYFTNINTWGVEAALNSKTNADSLLIKIAMENGKLAISGDIKSAKYGNGKTRLNISPGGILPSGFAELDNFTVIPNLKISGLYKLEQNGNELIVTGENTKLNGGQVGSIFTKMNVITNGFLFSSPDSGFNATMKGYITNSKYELFVYASNVPGLTAVSNIGFDMFNLGDGNFSGMMRVFQDKSDNFSLSAEISGNNPALKKGGNNYASTRLFYSHNVLSFKNMNFPNYNLNSDFTLIFSTTNNMTETISLNGMVRFKNIYNLPMIGKISIDNISGAADTEINIDKAIMISSKGFNNINAISVTAVQYPLTHIGLAGNISFKYDEDIDNDKIMQVNLKSVYSYQNRSVNLDFVLSKHDNYFSFDHFLIDTKDDKLLGHGKIYMQDKQLYGQVDFDKGGSLFFSSGSDGLYTLFQIKDFFVKDIIKDSLDVFVSGKVAVSWDISSPKASGWLKVINSENSKSFSLDVPDIRIEAGVCSLENVILRSEAYNADVNMIISDKEPGYSIDVKGKFGYYDFIKTEGAIVYYYQDDNQYLFYDLHSLSISGRTLYDIAGEVSIDGNSLTFQDREDHGLKGYYNSDGQAKKWDVSFNSKNIQAEYSGSIKRNIINAEFSLITPLDVLSSFTFMKDIRGDCSVFLSFGGNINFPVINGNIKLSQVYADFKDLGSKFKNLNSDIKITNNVMLLTNIGLATSMGDYRLDGSVYFNSVFNPSLDLTLKANSKTLPVFLLNINYPGFKVSGNLLIKELRFEGEISALNITGDVTVDNLLMYMSMMGGTTGTNKNVSPGILNNVRWKLPVHIGSGVKFSNEFIDVFLKKNETLTVGGTLADRTLNIKGNIDIDRGTLVYLGRDFTIDDGKAVFSGKPGDILPYVNLESSFKYRDEKTEQVVVFMTFTGKADDIVLSSFNSIPPKSSGELSAILGLQSQNETMSLSNINTGNGGFIPAGISSAAENAFIFSPLTFDLRRRLGLDMFIIRTGIIDSWARKTIYGETYLSSVDIFEGSTISIGKYIIPDIFLQYDLTISRNPIDINSLIALQTIGLDLDMKLFDIGWKLQPFTELGRQVLYEQFFELNFNQKF